VDPIKTLGTYNVPVRLHSDVSVPVTVDVVTEEQLELRKRQAEIAAAQAPATPAPEPETETPAESQTLETADEAASEAAGQSQEDSAVPAE
jgi:hypothetical protein